jgi:putative NIF3 family GTP cyclohydrolase 1 type 2
MLYFKIDDVLEINDLEGNKSPLGRICFPQQYQKSKTQFLLRDLLTRVSSHFNLGLIQYVGELKQEITKICIIPIETKSLLYIKKAMEQNCDALITSTINYKQAIFAKERGICLISIPFYNCIYFTLKKIYNFLSLKFPNDLFYFFEQVNPINYFNT